MSGGIDRRKIKNDACLGDLGQHNREPEIANPPYPMGVGCVPLSGVSLCSLRA
jgi:hypothetical protein